jgi:hypothetical protein
VSAQTVTRLPAEGPDDPWWVGYRDAAGRSGLSETALRVLEIDTDYILERGIFGAGRPDAKDGTWPASRVRRGLVVGSVQSGKTASMLGVAAKAVDAKVDIVVILSGTRIALWKQTLDRTLEQLDGWDRSSGGERERARILLPPPNVVAGRGATPTLDALYHVHPSRVRRTLEQGRPMIAVVMKQADHLIRFGGHLRKSLESTFRRLNRPVHLLVIDDEADDGSILDAVVEAGLGPASEGLKQIPRHIARLWSSRADDDSTFDSGLFATYVAYTATPQANLLQSDHNPLSPRDFVVALRTPFDAGNVHPPRSITYAEPNGLPSFYTGGDCFYSRFPNEQDGLCCPLEFPERDDFESDEEFDAAIDEQRHEQLGDALRAFFVGTAMRLFHGNRRISRARALSPSTYAEVAAASPPPSSMLVHPSAAIDEQVRAARLIARWSSGLGVPEQGSDHCPVDEAGRPTLDTDGLASRLDQEGDRWKEWFDTFERTRQLFGGDFPNNGFKRNEGSAWSAVRELLLQEVFPYVRLAMINSDPRADDRPMFRPVEISDGLFEAPPDLISIFVSGNVMSRGVTLEGLTTTVFLRSSKSPAADTQMQMQRWFGYRGSHLYWCRVFLYQDQLDLFRAYYENDLALGSAVLAEMNDPSSPAPAPLVLQGRDFRATAKIANLRALPLCPGRQPFVSVLARGDAAESNSALLGDLLDQGQWSDLTVGATRRGLIWDRELSLVDVAEILEGFRYQDHDPDPDGRQHSRWSALAGVLDLEAPVAPLFRPPGMHGSIDDLVRPDRCPYSIAAYLRLWDAALTRKAPGLFPTDDYRTPWSMIDQSKYAASAPLFRVGVRFGKGLGIAQHERLRKHGVWRMKRDYDEASGVVHSTWGSQNPGKAPDAYFGDHLFDYHVTGLTPPGAAGVRGVWRPRGHPGLVLFHVIWTEEGESESVTVGLGLPLGGPDHFAAIAPAHGGTGT